jgi:hypothetical protein
MSTVGFVLVDTRTKQIFTKQSSATEINAAQSSAKKEESARKGLKLHCQFLIILITFNNDIKKTMVV